MADHATPNLPARNFDATEAFYAQLGFKRSFRDRGWMILSRETAKLEFFPYPDLDPYQSSFGCCVRLDDLEGIMAQLVDSDIPRADTGIPRFHLPKREASGITIAYMVDPDGSLIRLIQND